MPILVDFVRIVHIALCATQAPAIAYSAAREFADTESERAIVFLMVLGVVLVPALLGGSLFLWLVPFASFVSGLALVYGIRKRVLTLSLFVVAILLKLFVDLVALPQALFVDVIFWTIAAIGLAGDLTGDVITGALKDTLGSPSYFVVLATTWAMASFTAPFVFEDWAWIDKLSGLAFLSGGAFALFLRRTTYFKVRTRSFRFR